MKELFDKHQSKLIVLILLLVPALLLLTSRSSEVGHSPSSSFGRWGKGAMGWGQLGVITATSGVVGNISGWFTSESTEELDRLELENRLLREEKARLIGVLQENARLRELVGFKQGYPNFELVPARVISRDVTPYFRVIKVRVDATDARIKPRMPVVVAGGVVGQVHDVQDGWADVVVLSDPRSRIDVISQRNRAHGVVQGLGHERDYAAKISYLSEKDKIGEGDVIVTSGMGGVFPRELIVGRVTSVAPDERGLFQDVQIQPAVDLSRIDEVFIITSTIDEASGQVAPLEEP